MLELNKAYNMDCMEGMREFPDGYFDLAVVDPPYGDAGQDFKRQDKSRFGGKFDRYKREKLTGGGTAKIDRRGGGHMAKYGTKIIGWDTAPGDDYFQELFRVSKQQIIWGGNYFYLPPNRCFLVWEKTNIPENFSMAMAEYAWCSFNDNAKIVKCSSSGSGRFHPTQKPVELYAWIFEKYAKPGFRILDTHLGSGSSRIAAWDSTKKLDFIGFEIDEDYFLKQEKRFDEHTRQLNLFHMMQ